MSRAIAVAAFLFWAYWIADDLGWGKACEWLCRADITYAPWLDMLHMGVYLQARLAYYFVMPALILFVLVYGAYKEWSK